MRTSPDVNMTCRTRFLLSTDLICLCGCPVKKRFKAFRVRYTYRSSLAHIWWLHIGIVLTCFGLVSCNTDTICSKVSKMKLHQARFCDQHPEVVKALYRGVHLGRQECQRQFQNSSLTFTRWNCSNTEVDEKSANPLFDIPQPRVGSREAAVFRAFIGAGMLHSLVSACLNGIPGCTKEHLYSRKDSSILSKQLDFSVPMQYLNRFFALSESPTIKDELDLHNMGYGYKEVEKRTHMTKKCLMGTICMKGLQPLSESSKAIRGLYGKSKRFQKKTYTRLTDLMASSTKWKESLLHFRSAFNYCEHSTTWNWSGIGRRPCRTDVSGTYESCNILCCNYGHIRVAEFEKKCRIASTFPYKTKCWKEAKVNRFYCKYMRETQKTKAFQKWQDPLHLKVLS